MRVGDEKAKILQEGVRRDGETIRRVSEREREGKSRMNVYSMISKTGGNKTTSTLSNHREATPIALAPSQAKNKTFSHTLPFVAAEVRVWSSFYLEL